MGEHDALHGVRQPQMDEDDLNAHRHDQTGDDERREQHQLHGALAAKLYIVPIAIPAGAPIINADERSSAARRTTLVVRPGRTFVVGAKT